MIFWFLLFLVFIIAIVQASISPLNFLLVIVMVSAIKMDGIRALFLAFISGFFLDLFSAAPVGLSSILFLVFSGTILALKQRFSLVNPILRFVATLVFYSLFQFLEGSAWKMFEVIFLSVLVSILGSQKEKIIL